MADGKTIYLCSISGGKCLENTQKEKGECRLRKWNKTPAQQWIIEPSETEANTFAFKSVADEQYLAALQPDKRNGGKIGVQAEKQWFTLEPGRGPELFHVKCNSSYGGGKAGYLNDEWGRMNDDNKIQTYQHESNNPGFNTFYFSLVQNADKEVLALTTASADDRGAANEEAEAKEKDLKKREEEVEAREKAASGKEAAVKKREEELAQQKTRGGKLADPSNTEEQSEQMRALEQRELALSRREKELDKREKGLASSQPPAENAITSPTTEESLSSTTSQAAQRGNSEDVHEACKLRRENDGLRYKLKIGELEAKLKESACQHKVRRPPRKIDHKVVGYVYR